jgi:alpha-beta hydrolase superfamily lysophospholipase
MLPLYFGPPQRPLFGVYHPPGDTPRGAGVVLCNPFGHEELNGHRAMRHLAERLAARGIAALRFDYDATGDSAGDDREGGRVAAWRASIALAARALREKAGVSKVALVGLRAGALLAIATAADAGADRLVLWSPVVSGRAHAKELLRLHKLLFPRPKGEGAPREDEETLGFALRKDTAADLGKVDALALGELPVAGALVIGGNESPSEDKLLDKLRELGIETEYRHLPGHPFLVTDPHRSLVPDEMIAAIVEHLCSKYPTPDGSTAERPIAPLRPAIAEGGPDGERAWLFGAPKPRFGVLTPAKEKGDRPAIVLMNAGSIHHIGPSRMSVRLARRWADLGYTVLRMDLSGIGESTAIEGSPTSAPYPKDAVLDAQAAMTALEEAGHGRRFILGGLCSGADIAFRAGVIDRRVVGAWMINPQAFYFESSDALKEFLAADLQAQYYQSGVWDLDRWKKMVRGEVDLARIAGILRTSVGGAVKRRLARLLGEGAAPRGPEAKDVTADLRAMADRGADTFLLCSEDDPGLVYLQKYFGRGLAELAGARGFRREVVKGTDHTFTPLWSQDLLSDMLTEHLRQKHG